MSLRTQSQKTRRSRETCRVTTDPHPRCYLHRRCAVLLRPFSLSPARHCAAFLRFDSVTPA
jgi:hypothetical protein